MGGAGVWKAKCTTIALASAVVQLALPVLLRPELLMSASRVSTVTPICGAGVAMVEDGPLLGVTVVVPPAESLRISSSNVHTNQRRSEPLDRITIWPWGILR